jgi:hypothetical protein
MPDTNGLPTTVEVLDRCTSIIGDDAVGLDAFVPSVLSGVIAHFQSPPGPHKKGGTGKNWIPVNETRYFDGHGQPELVVHDIRPPNNDLTQPVNVTVFTIPLTDAFIKQARSGDPHNVLYRHQWNGTALSVLGDNGILAVPGIGVGTPFPPRIFPSGIQNIAVTALWGAGPLSADIYEAILGEVCYRSCVLGVVGLNGVGEDIKMEGFELNTSVGAINFETTSPLTVMHNSYLACVESYRRRVVKSRVRMAHKMV